MGHVSSRLFAAATLSTKNNGRVIAITELSNELKFSSITRMISTSSASSYDLFLASKLRPVISARNVNELYVNPSKTLILTLRLRKTEDGEDRRCDVCERALLFLLPILLLVLDEAQHLRVTGHDERNFVRGVRRVRRARVRVDHLFRVSVVRSNEEDVPSLLCGLVNGSHRLVGSGDSLDGRVIDSGVSDLDGESAYRRARKKAKRERTMSGGAKLHITNSCLSSRRTSATLFATSWTDMCGCLSYVATFGDGMRCRSSLSNCFSTPPLKKNVTCAYFSVSAMCACLTPFFASHSASTFVIACGGKATGKVNSGLYRDMVVMCC